MTSFRLFCFIPRVSSRPQAFIESSVCRVGRTRVTGDLISLRRELYSLRVLSI